MKLATVVGPRQLEYADAGDGLFMCLAQYALKDAEYRTYYKEKAQEGNEVILDNGAAEKQVVPWVVLLELADDIKPAVVVTPDVLFNSVETMRKIGRAHV